MSGLPKPPPMKVMLTDMYECCDNLLEDAGISHNAVLVDLKKGSNAKFLQTNISLMMTLIKLLLESAQEGCGGCSEYIKELEEKNKELEEQLNEESKEKLKNKECWMSVQKQYHELKDEKDSWQDGEFKLTKLLSEEREKNVDLLNEIELLKSQMKMKQQYEKQFDNLSQELNKLRQQLDKIDN